MFSPIELEIELFCRGMRIDPSCDVGEDGRRIARTRAGLGSGLELVLAGGAQGDLGQRPGRRAVRRGVAASCLVTSRRDVPHRGRARRGTPIRSRFPPEPAWYAPQDDVGRRDEPHRRPPGQLPRHLRLEPLPLLGLVAVAGLQVLHDGQERRRRRGVAQEGRRRRRSGARGARRVGLRSSRTSTPATTSRTSTGSRRSTDCGSASRSCARSRAQVGGFIGVQGVPVPRRKFSRVRRPDRGGRRPLLVLLRVRGSRRSSRGSAPARRRRSDSSVLRSDGVHGAAGSGRGRVSGEIIAGLEPIDATKRGIDRIVNAGAFPTVCIFRPTIGSEIEDVPPPDPDEMKEVFAHLWETCRRAGLPVGILPIEVSLVVQPEETRDLAAAVASVHALRAGSSRRCDSSRAPTSPGRDTLALPLSPLRCLRGARREVDAFGSCPPSALLLRSDRDVRRQSRQSRAFDRGPARRSRPASPMRTSPSAASPRNAEFSAGDSGGGLSGSSTGAGAERSAGAPISRASRWRSLPTSGS